jgi:hypothetical protein
MLTKVRMTAPARKRAEFEEELRVETPLNHDSLSMDACSADSARRGGSPSSMRSIVPLRTLPVLHPALRELALSWARSSPMMLLGVWTLSGFGCASFGGDGNAPPTAQSEMVRPEAVRSNPPATASRPERVVFSDEATDASGGLDAATLAQGQSGGDGLVDALASSYSADMQALSEMQTKREAARQRAPVSAQVAFEGESAASPVASPVASTAPVPANGATETAIQVQQPIQQAQPQPRAQAEPSQPSTSVAASTAAVPPTTNPPTATAASAAPVATVVPTPTLLSGPTQANSALEIQPPVPTDPGELAKLLAESLVKRSLTSTEPVRDWLAFAALALANPSLALPGEFGADLLPAERERITNAHAAFATIGRILAEGGAIDTATTDALVAALAGGPKLIIPKVELCTKVESFGRFSPLGNNRFLPRSNARFIVYSELQGFSSGLENGQYVTRLATRIAIESERDGIEVWARSPEWTAVVDASPVRREDFFVGEIVPVSEYLSIGSYRLKVEIRDEATGVVATAFHPIQIVADPAMAAVGD